MLLHPLTLLCCGKSFDKVCLEKHLKAHPIWGATCPICRNALPARVPAVRVGLVVVRVLLVS